MFKTDLTENHRQAKCRAGLFSAPPLWRRRSYTFWFTRKSQPARPTCKVRRWQKPQEVDIVEFNRFRRTEGVVHDPRSSKAESEWKKQLTPNAFDIRAMKTRSGVFRTALELHDKGLYRCICCDTALFSSTQSFESGTGWPSFWQPIAEENVRENPGPHVGMTRTLWPAACVTRIWPRL